MSKKGDALYLQNCAICKSNFGFEDKILIFKCHHQIHFDCLKVKKNNKRIDVICPICNGLELEELIAPKQSLEKLSEKDIQKKSHINIKKFFPKLKRIDTYLKNK